VDLSAAGTACVCAGTGLSLAFSATGKKVETKHLQLAR